MSRISNFLSFLFILTICVTRLGVHAKPSVPCFFIFGDSLSDAGNNNNLSTKARANYPPYGIDFPGKVPTGRFTNGRTAVDFISENLGFKGYIPPFSTAKGHELAKGVNYASGSAGIRHESGKHLGKNINLGQQVENHQTVVKQLKGLVKEPVEKYMSKCLYTINVGSNDYLNNYFLPRYYQTKRLYNPDQFAAALIDQYAKDIKGLYASGARKIALFELGFLGCALAEVIQYHPRGFCVTAINIAVDIFNVRLKFLVDQLNHSLPGAKIILVHSQVIQLTPFQGFMVLTKPCCTLREDKQCKEKASVCNDRKRYLFFDGFHPTEAVNRFIADRSIKAVTPLDVYPYDIRKLLQL